MQKSKLTKFILHGGYAAFDCNSNHEFYNKFVKENDSILLFPFAQPKENRPESYKKDKQRFIKHNKNKNLNFISANDNIEDLISKIKESDVLYFRGGITKGHLDIMNQIPNLKELLIGKTILGTSAGALMRSKHYYTQDFEEVRIGNGFLDIKMITHIGSNYSQLKTDKERITELTNFGEKKEILKIDETKYVEYDIDSSL